MSIETLTLQSVGRETVKHSFGIVPWQLATSFFQEWEDSYNELWFDLVEFDRPVCYCV